MCILFYIVVILRPKWTKPKVMCANSQSSPSISLDGNIIEQVIGFVYLGSLVNSEGGIWSRNWKVIRLASTSFSQLNKWPWKFQSISLTTEIESTRWASGVLSYIGLKHGLSKMNIVVNWMALITTAFVVFYVSSAVKECPTQKSLGALNNSTRSWTLQGDDG